MLTALVLFFRKHVFSSAGVLIIPILLLIGIFVMSNTDTILSKFGFETKSSIKAELVVANEGVKQAGIINENLNKAIDAVTSNAVAVKEAIVSNYKEQDKAKDIVAKISEHKKALDLPIEQRLKEKTVTTATTITIPIAEVNELSASNIDSLNDTYDQLFPEKVENHG